MWENRNNSSSLYIYIYNQSNRTAITNGSNSKHKPSPSPLGCQAISPRVQFRSQPAGALAAPGEQGRCDGSPAAAGGAPERAQGHAAPMP